jgi:flagellar export protein FliJ
MRFKFSLATALRLREIAEQREERLLGQILNQISQSRQTLSDLEVQRRDLVAQRELALQQTASAFDITHFYDRIRQIDEMERIAREQLAKLATLREQQMKIYETAHRNRELLSGMRSDQLDAFEREQTRQEQNAMDDNFSSRRRFQ